MVAPYFQVIVDTSGSMGAGCVQNCIPFVGCEPCPPVPNSCGVEQTRINAAKCVLNDIVNAYGEVTFGLSEFQMACGLDGGDDVYTATCSGESANDGRTLVPIFEDNQSSILSFVDFLPVFGDQKALSCPGTSDPGEILVNNDGFGLTALAGSLRSARRYFEGGDPDFGTSPIATDPFNTCPRPYYVILLTDGDETCADDGRSDVEDAAIELRSTVVPGVGTFDIQTFVIGFGISPGDEDIEAIAAAGGTDAPGPNRGFYASNEEELAIAFAQIVQDSLLVEVCDNADNDCDGAIDEGFVKFCDLESGISTTTLCTDPGDPCDGEDDNCFNGTADEATNACGVCGPTPTEICNGLDDDCDGFIDEGGVCGGCSPEPEICDGQDNDCDDRIDEGVSRPCGTDVGLCSPGIEICVEQMTPQPEGEWGPCSDVGPEPEICDGLDNDCDGLDDGFSNECYEFPTGCELGVGCEGVCRTGEQICSGGVFGECVGDVGPGTEICNLLDDDCDGDTDEGNPGGGAPCSTGCGVGETQCVDGVITCVGGGDGMPEECNGFDDDCDGLTDEGIPDMGPCDEGGTLCEPGLLECVGGAFQCVGGVEPEIEQCDCEDNDCDGETDEGKLCGAGATCLGGPYCLCAQPCADGEFPCPLGSTCVDDPGGTGDRFCVPDPCFQVDCNPLPNGDPTECVEGECLPLCDSVTCGDPLVCRPADGVCVEDNCNGFPDRCEDSELCIDGTCIDNPCFGVDCPAADEFCRDGACVGSCAGVSCPEGQSCDGGSCVDDPCADAGCPSFQTCDPDTGECVQDMCGGVFCPPGTVCDPVTGECERDPCLEVECPAGQVCVGGNCYDPGDLVQPDAGNPEDRVFVSPGGGAGCACDTGGGGDPGGGWMLVLFAAALGLRRRRQ